MGNKFNIKTEPVERCPLCRGAEKSERLRTEMAGGGEARFVDCPSCGLVYLDPAPGRETLEVFYRDVYATPEYRKADGFDALDPREELGGAFKYCEHLMNEVEDYRTPPGKLLDVGCAYGGFVLDASTRGWKAEGVEPFADAAAFCRDMLGLSVSQGDIFTAELKEEEYDVITLYEVIEHLDRPVQAMRKLAKLAKPGALLALTTPNPNSPAAILAKANWIGWKPPTHLCLFDFHSVRALLERGGWTPLKIKGCGMYPGQITAFAEKKQG